MTGLVESHVDGRWCEVVLGTTDRIDSPANQPARDDVAEDGAAQISGDRDVLRFIAGLGDRHQVIALALHLNAHGSLADFVAVECDVGTGRIGRHGDRLGRALDDGCTAAGELSNRDKGESDEVIAKMSHGECWWMDSMCSRRFEKRLESRWQTAQNGDFWRRRQDPNRRGQTFVVGVSLSLCRELGIGRDAVERSARGICPGSYTACEVKTRYLTGRDF